MKRTLSSFVQDGTMAGAPTKAKRIAQVNQMPVQTIASLNRTTWACR